MDLSAIEAADVMLKVANISLLKLEKFVAVWLQLLWKVMLAL